MLSKNELNNGFARSYLKFQEEQGILQNEI